MYRRLKRCRNRQRISLIPSVFNSGYSPCYRQSLHPEPTFVEPQPNDREVMMYHSFNVTHPYVAVNVEVSVSRPDAQLVVFMSRGNKPNLTQYDWVWKVQLPLNFTVDGEQRARGRRFKWCLRITNA